jgi:hypothetical protein
MLKAALVLLVTLSSSRAADSAPKSHWHLPLSQAIDREIGAVLQARKLNPAEAADDAELMRRVYLDLLGRVPTVQEAEAYLEDKSADKGHRLIDALLVHAEMQQHWAEVINYWLNGRESKPGLAEFRVYLRKGIESDKPWDMFAREMVLPDAGDPGQQPAAYFLASRLSRPKDERLDAVTAAVSSGLFGVRLECARCHDHPMVDEWKQDHYYGLAAFFARTEGAGGNKPVLTDKGTAEATFVTTNKETKTARLMFLDNKVFDAPAAPVSRRKLLVDHAFTRENPFFKRALVNRVWKQLMGRGLVEPVDQMHSANEPTHPELLRLLADDFGDNRFSLRRLIAGILHSDTYRRSSRWAGPGELPATSAYAVANLRALSPEQLSLSMLRITGYADNAARGKASANLRDLLEKDVKVFIDRFDNESGRFQASASQALFLTFNQATQKYLQPTGGLIARLARVGDNREAARQAYLAVLSRRPSDEEIQAAVEYLSAASPREELCRDLVWALLNSAEFRFNH